MASHVYSDDQFHNPPLPYTVVARPHHDRSANYPHAVSPMSADECSPDDSGYLGQVVNTHHNMKHHAHGAQYPSRHAQSMNGQRRSCEYRTRLPNQKTGSRRRATKHHGNKKKSPSQLYNELTWRMDPVESLSDFTLIVIGTSDSSRSGSSSQKRRQKWNVEGLFLDMSGSEDERDECNNHGDKEHRMHDRRQSKHNYQMRKEYHLHKVNLAVGPRSCEYFAHLFQRQQRGKPHGDNSQHSIELPLSCLNSIPIMLDYIYASQANDQVHATVETAVSLRYLATVFGNRSLFDSATAFIQNDLRPETAITYLLEADMYRQKKLRNVCTQICAEEFDRLKIRHLAMIPPRLLESILYSDHFHSDNYAVCSMIAAYCRCQESNIDGLMLLAFTDASIIPEIYPEEALYFIKTMLSMGMNLDYDVGQDEYQCRVRSLYERCISAAPSIVHEVLDSFCHSPGRDNVNPEDMRLSNVKTRQSKMVCADYRQLPPQVKVDLLEYTLAKHQTGSI